MKITLAVAGPSIDLSGLWVGLIAPGHHENQRACELISSAIIWAASAAALDRAEEAREAVEYCLAQRPDLRVEGVVPGFMFRFARDEDHQRLLALLRKAGLPE